MKRKTIAAIIIALGSGGAYASDFVDTAQVISATPIIERVNEPRQECTTEAAPAPRLPQERSMAAPILGGIAGALLGHQIGHGSGNAVATAVGAVGGAVAGDVIANPNADRSYAGTVIGGTAGAVLGNQVGNGSGNTVATAAGAITGAMAGDRIGARQAAGTVQPTQRCRTVESTREVVKGYNVVYRYNGRDIATTLPYNPGGSVRVGVGVIDNGGVADSGGRDARYSNSAMNTPPDYARPAGNYNYR